MRTLIEASIPGLQHTGKLWATVSPHSRQEHMLAFLLAHVWSTSLPHHQYQMLRRDKRKPIQENLFLLLGTNNQFPEKNDQDSSQFTKFPWRFCCLILSHEEPYQPSMTLMRTVIPHSIFSAYETCHSTTSSEKPSSDTSVWAEVFVCSFLLPCVRLCGLHSLPFIIGVCLCTAPFSRLGLCSSWPLNKLIFSESKH